MKNILGISAFSALWVTNSPLLLNSGPVFPSACCLCTQRTLSCIFGLSGQFQFELSFYISNCLCSPWQCPCSSPWVFHLWYASFSVEQTQKLTFKPRESLTPPTFLTFEGHELVLCFRDSVLKKLTALSSFIFHGNFPGNLSQLS